jgi:hypothetical protein
MPGEKVEEGRGGGSEGGWSGQARRRCGPRLVSASGPMERLVGLLAGVLCVLACGGLCPGRLCMLKMGGRWM